MSKSFILSFAITILTCYSCTKESEVLPPYIGGTYLCNEELISKTYVPPSSFVNSTKDTSYILTIEYANRSTNSIYFQGNYCTLDKNNTYKWYYHSGGGSTSDSLHFEESKVYFRRGATSGPSTYLTTITGKRIN